MHKWGEQKNENSEFSNNFCNNNSENKRICNQCYKEIIDYMTDKEQKYRKKYNNINY